MLLLRALGGVSVEGAMAADGFLQRPRVLSLLALLAGGGPAGLARDSVLALLWPESDTCRARANLKQLAFQARRLGGLPIALGEGGVVRLDVEPRRVDVWTFEQAARRNDRPAMARAYGGAFLDGFVPPSGLDELGRWIERRRAALREQYQAALGALCAEAAAAGDMDGLIGHRRCLVDLDPLSSRATLSLMHALVAADDRPAALAAARSHARRVRAELDTDPDPTLLRFERELRRLSNAEVELPVVGVSLADLPAPRARPPLGRPADGVYWMAGD
jgi:DNA-binding SARP family transcriptional activator